MERYANRGGSSNIFGYEIEPSAITVRFNDGATYLYTGQSAGAANVEQMKQLATAGQGLNSFINRVVRNQYESKDR